MQLVGFLLGRGLGVPGSQHILLGAGARVDREVSLVWSLAEWAVTQDPKPHILKPLASHGGGFPF